MAFGPGDGVMGVERSLTGRAWQARPADERTALALCQKLGAPEIIGRVLAGRGVGPEEAVSFLNPTLRDLLPDPGHLRDMEVAVARLRTAIEGRERIAIFGDYDVDGATSAALLSRYFAALGVSVDAYIPDRQKEGYGPNAPALRRLRAAGVDVVITVDCGITAFEALEDAAKAGLDVIVVDHHVAEPRLPRACAIINPNRLDDDSAHGQMAAVGVAFLLVVALNRTLREADFFGPSRREPDLMGWLDIVALGTVCDVVPLTGVNRALVTQGLKVMARRANPGLACLADLAGQTRRPDAYLAGFVLGPRINAGGRVGKSDLGYRLLTTNDPLQAAALAHELDTYNDERRRIESDVLDQAIAQVEADKDTLGGPLVIAGQGWHPGVIGIVASRLRERFHLPACVIALPADGEDGMAKGSGRSVAGIDLGAAVIAARQAGLLVNGGGHKMAAGFTLEAARIDEFRAFLATRIGALAAASSVRPVLSVDGALLPAAATFDLAELLESMGPFGAGNPQPRFVFPAVRVVRADVVGDAHVRCILSGPGGKGLKAIAFRSVETPLGKALLGSAGSALHIAGSLRTDEWQGRKEAQLFIDDAALPTGAQL